MNWEIVSALCAASGMLVGGLNVFQNVRIELKVERLRNELLEQQLQPLRERVTTLEAQMTPLLSNCPLLHAQRAA